MSRLRLIFVLSLLVLAGVFVAIIYFIPSGKSYTESTRARIIVGENEWILQYDIVNGQAKDIRYTISVSVDGAVYTDSTVVRPGKTYTYIHHIYPEQLKEGKVTLTLYEGDKTEPVEQVTYHLGRD